MSRVVKFTQPGQIDRLLTVFLFALAFALYARTMARDVLPGDPGEFQFAAWNFGVAHATGYPTYLILGGVWQRLLAVLGVSPALALNLLSALFGASAVALFYRVMASWLPGEAVIRRTTAAFSAALLAANPTFWSQSLIAEVYALHGLFIVLLLWAIRRLSGEDGQSQRSPIPIFLLLGLSLTHHATTLLLIPGILLALWFNRRAITRDWRHWLGAVFALIAPLLLYLYVPLRATPMASPWFYPNIGGETLSLYENSRQGFMDFVTGQSISVGFYGLEAGLANVGQGWFLWRLHFGAAGLLLAAFGLYSLIKGRRWDILAVTGWGIVAQQTFNLFYAIQDILVYYIPLYIFVTVWIGFGAAQLGNGFMSLAEQMGRNAGPSPQADPAASTQPSMRTVAVLVIALLFLLPFRQAMNYLPSLDQSRAVQARQSIEAILAAAPPQNALLATNDRDEMTPIYYTQFVENRRPDLTGVFPLIAPQARFADMGATLDTLLANAEERPIMLIKPMPGLEVRFELTPTIPPLVQVNGPAVGTPQVEINQAYGPLTLLGFDWVQTGEQTGENVELRLYWLVDDGLPGVYTTTAQVFDAGGAKIAQSDIAPGGVYYPTSLWKPGERLVETHSLSLPAGQTPVSLLIGMYTAAALENLAPPMVIDLGAYRLNE